MAAQGIRTIPDSAGRSEVTLNGNRQGMKPRFTTVPTRPHPPRLRKAPGVVVEKQDDGADVQPSRRRRLSKPLALSILAHVVILLGASYWVIARRPDARQPAGERGGDPFPLMQRGTQESFPNTPATHDSTPLALRTLPEPDLPQPVLDQFLDQTTLPPLDMPGPMFVEEAPPEPLQAKDQAAATAATERIDTRPKKTPGGSPMKSGKSARKASATSTAPNTPGPSVGSSFALGQLDGKPRLLHHPAAVFPVELIHQGASSGTVVLNVELDESGSVRVLGLVSATHPSLVAEAKRVAAGSSFTPPMREGRHVKARMTWPIIIRR